MIRLILAVGMLCCLAFGAAADILLMGAGGGQVGGAPRLPMFLGTGTSATDGLGTGTGASDVLGVQ